MQQKLASEI